MASLGDFLPQNLKDELAKNNILPGAILKAFVKDIFPPKEKYFIIVAFSIDKIAIATVYINSQINPNKFPTEELRKFHLELKASDNNFLGHDSFADCTQLHEKNYEELFRLLQTQPAVHIGVLQTDHKRSLHNLPLH